MEVSLESLHPRGTWDILVFPQKSCGARINGDLGGGVEVGL